MATQLKDEASIEQIIKEMSREEKVQCITGGSLFYTKPMEKYGIPKLYLLDGGTGLNILEVSIEEAFQDYVDELEASGECLDESEYGRMGGYTPIMANEKNYKKYMDRYAANAQMAILNGCYPPGMVFGATWNPEVTKACGHELGKEMNAAGVDILLGSPNVNISRDPLNGRLFEGYSEDPCLTAKLAPCFSTAVQDEGVIANVKHFAANNQETERMGINEIISERALREIYLPGFKAVIDAGCRTVMTAYNKINGYPCAENHWLLHDVLRGEWGFKGFVMSDWSAAYDQVEACAAGNDLVMPGPRSTQPLLDALEDGTLKEEDVDECVRNILRVTLDTIAFKGGRLPYYDITSGMKAAYDAAAEAITLLKNDGVLPLRKDEKPAVFGKYSKNIIACGGGSADAATGINTEILDCLDDEYGYKNVTFGEVTDDSTVVIVTVGSMGHEGADRQNMLMDADDRKTLDAAVKAAKEKDIPVVVLMNVAGPIQVYDWEKDADAILCIYFPGMQGAHAAVDILTGKVNPSGKLPVTFPREYRDCPTYGNFPGYNYEVIYGEGIYVGYRYYERKGIDVMYPFGYGLSYTSFEITGAEAPSRVNLDSEDAAVTVTVKNTGDIAGSEVIQLYVSDVISTIDKPLKELKAFRKVYLLPGEVKEVTLVLGKQDFASYDTKLKDWVVEPGEFKLCIGNSSDNIRAVLDLDVSCENPYALGPVSEIVVVMSTPGAADIVNNITGINLLEAAGSYIVAQPLTPFSKVWHDAIVPYMKVDAEAADQMEQEIYAAWKNIEPNIEASAGAGAVSRPV